VHEVKAVTPGHDCLLYSCTKGTLCASGKVRVVRRRQANTHSPAFYDHAVPGKCCVVSAADGDEENQSAVRIYLSHMYTHEAFNAAGLKGADRVLYTQFPSGGK